MHERHDPAQTRGDDAPAPAAPVHAEAFLGFVYGLLRRQTFVVPGGASAYGLAGALGNRSARARVAQVLTTLALERLVRAAPVAPPHVVRGEQVVAAQPWDEAVAHAVRREVGPAPVQALANLFVAASAAFPEATLNDEAEVAHELLAFGRRLHLESEAFQRAAASLPPTVLAWTQWSAAPPADSLGLLDLVLLDDVVAAIAHGAQRVQRDADMDRAWSEALGPLLAISPLSALLRHVERVDVASAPTFDATLSSVLSEPASEAALAPLFAGANHLLLRFMEADFVATWCTQEARSRQRAGLRDAWLRQFVGVMTALFALAERHGTESVLAIVPRLYEELFRRHPDRQFVRYVRTRMRTLSRLSERQALIAGELKLFAPLRRFVALRDSLRGMSWAERTAEQAYLIDRPFPALPQLRDSVRYCEEKLARPFGHIVRE